MARNYPHIARSHMKMPRDKRTDALVRGVLFRLFLHINLKFSRFEFGQSLLARTRFHLHSNVHASLRTLVLPHQFRLREDAAFHRGEDLLFIRAFWKVEHRIKRVELKEVPVRARRWTRPAPAATSP